MDERLEGLRTELRRDREREKLVADFGLEAGDALELAQLVAFEPFGEASIEDVGEVTELGAGAVAAANGMV